MGKFFHAKFTRDMDGIVAGIVCLSVFISDVKGIMGLANIKSEKEKKSKVNRKNEIEFFRRISKRE
ncbi:hypothetical protein BJM33_05885 [Listeria monocytogenes]|nr:hypothetical protein BJM33_05885 [Listeria monocytogenes]OFG49157.1 hypothetical protein BJM57_02050 [Listeria monocytogenes]OFG66331.1 hypothetical protein BJM71_06455 [Listeria monocytogenes]